MLNKTKQEVNNKESKAKPTDEELIARFQEGNMYAYDQIVHRYQDQLVNFVYMFLGDRSDSEDVVQETFLRVYRNKHMYKQVAKFSTWIYTIAGNLAKTELRRRRRRKILSLTQMGFEDKDYELPADTKTPEKIIDGEMREKLIRKEIDELPVRFKEVIVLRDVEEFSYEEISQILDIPIGTVKSRVNRARSRLQNRLKFLWDK